MSCQLVLCLALAHTFMGCNGEPQTVAPSQTATQPRTVAEPLAIRVTVISYTRGGPVTTNTVWDPSSVASLEALFPEYHTTPESDVAAGYIAQYRFTFELPDGTKIEVKCDGKGELWSTGHGDFRVNGDLRKTLSELKKE